MEKVVEIVGVEEEVVSELVGENEEREEGEEKG